MLRRSAFFKTKKLFSGAYATFRHEQHDSHNTLDEHHEDGGHVVNDNHPTDQQALERNQNQTVADRFLKYLNDHAFDSAEPLLHKLQAMNHVREYATTQAKQCIEKPIVRIRFFPHDLEEQRRHAMQNAINQFCDLLANPQLCSELLKSLDAQIAVFQTHLHCDFSKLSPGPGYRLNATYLVPSESILQKPTIDTHDVLLYLLRKQLAKDGIDTQDTVMTFFQFINEDIANNLVRQGMLFHESPLSGNAILHGLYSHYFQWYLFSMAIEKGIVRLQPGINLYEIMTATVDSKVTYTIPLWSNLIDHADDAENNSFYFQRYLGSPYCLNLFLLFSPSTPHLRGYLLNEWARDITCLQIFFYERYKKAISYENLVMGFAIADEKLDGLHLQITKQMIAQFYREKKYKQVNSDTGILLESAQEKFAWAREADREINSLKLLC